MSVEEKLAKIFDESFQVKRLSKEISDIKDLREKGQYDIRMTVLKNQCLVFRVELLTASFKETKVPKQFQFMQEIKIIIRNNYPAHPPKAYFMNNNMAKIGIKPFRDYFPVILGELAWSAKFTIVQIIKSFPNFIQKILKTPIASHPFPTFQEYFELDSLLSWNFVQVHPIRLIKKSGQKQGFMIINIPLCEVVIVDEAGLESSYKTCEYIRGSEILSLRKKKNTTNRLLLQVKLSYPKLKGKYGIQFYSQDYDGLMIGIMDCARISVSEASQEKKKDKKGSDSSSDSEEDNEEDEEQKRQRMDSDEPPLNIQQIQESIIVYQSLVDNNMTSENINQLVQLLKKAIEFYSASGDNRFRVYLDKLQNILSNETAQVLLESENDSKSKVRQRKETQKEQQFASVIDLL